MKNWKRIGFAALALIAVLSTIAIGNAFANPDGNSGIKPFHLFRGLWIFRVDTGDTTANTKVARFQNAAGTDKATIDIEGDFVCHDAAVGGTLTSTGNFSVGAADQCACAAASGNFSAKGTGVVNGNFSVGASTGTFRVTAASGNVATDGTLSATGAISGPVTVVSASTGSTPLTAAQSGALVVNTGTGGTTTFTLPDAAAGLRYCFVEAGDAAGELLVNVQASDLIVGRANDATGHMVSAIATAAGTGIKNTAATNIKGDFACVVALDATTWLMTSVAGVWASQ